MSLDPFYNLVSQNAHVNEQAMVRTLLKAAADYESLEPQIKEHASQLVTQLRKKGAGSGIEAFLHEYGLNTSEGVAVMCLAEALLRIPDSETADRLIRDKFEHAEWEKHIGKSDHWFVNASSWGLMLTGRVINLSLHQPNNTFKKMVGRVGEPTIREALRQGMKFIGSKFVLGEHIKDALAHSKPHIKKGYRYSYDMLGEAARTDEQARGYVEAYRKAIEAIAKETDRSKPLFARPNISIKLSALHARYGLAQKERVIAELLPRLSELAVQAREHGISVSIDAEEASRLDIELEVFATLIKNPAFKDWAGIGFVVQAYQKTSYYLIDWLAELARSEKRCIPVRLVKGAYWDAEIKHAQVEGLDDYPVYTRKEHTDLSYFVCAGKLLSQHELFYPQFATHNARTMAEIVALANHCDVDSERFEFQRLHGMGENLHDLTITQTPSRIYAPVGEHKDLLAYLIRRLLENGANTSFVHLLMNKTIQLDELLESHITKSKRSDGLPNPNIPLPADIYPDGRKNSAGVDLGNKHAWSTLQKQVKAFDNTTWNATPIVAVEAITGSEKPVFSPVDRSDQVGTVRELDAASLAEVITSAKASVEPWFKTGVEHRAHILEAVADSFEKHMPEFMAICHREAGKTVHDTVAEVREAADFCRYYAAQARLFMQHYVMPSPTGENNLLALYPRGVIACISPWNFPLAIFTGQVVAALVTGNAVLAKPAEQTPLIAHRAVEIMHQCGVPKAALQLVPGRGETIGAGLVAHEDIAGIVFTGSVETAKLIQRGLSNRNGAIVPLIAETGGLNCMVVDSSALLEQATDDIVNSAFGSAGQRCSALRVLFAQDDIADSLIQMIKGAMQELKVGDPALLSTDIGPVIDEDAQDILLKHIETMKQSATFIAASPMDEAATKQGLFVAPHAFEIENINQLERETFGPILHVVRFDDGDLQAVADAINGTGYGLTFGIHSRIEDNVEFFTERVHAGNMYINRGMTGAVVGVQPFGGEGLSGTGPKAGGPHYLSRFVIERTFTNNITSIGGNLALLSEGRM